MPPSEETIELWEPLGALAPALLDDARRALHENLLVVACLNDREPSGSAGRFLAGLDWSQELGAILAPGAELRGGLRLADAHLVLVEDGEVDAVFDLHHQSIDQSRIWFEAQCAASDLDFTADFFVIPESVREHVGPEVSGPFDFASRAACEELARYVSNAAHLLAEFTGESPRIVPRSFELCVERAGEVLGLSLGDAELEEPYLFVQRSTDAAELAELGMRGQWLRTSTGTRAALSASSLCTGTASGCQTKHAWAFLESSRAKLGG